MEGLSVCDRIRNHSAMADTPILFMSSSDDTLSKSRGFDAGAVDCVTKPLVGVEVIARVKTHLRLRHVCESLARLQGERTESVVAVQEVIMPIPAVSQMSGSPFR
jgi:DNA-binding response OmpR family regulator